MGGEKQRALGVAYLLVGVLLVAVAAGVGWRVYAQARPQPDVVILVAAIKPDGRDLGRDLTHQLGLALDDPAIALRRLSRAYANSEEAREDGTRRGADLVIWGDATQVACELLPPMPPPITFAGEALLLPERLVWDLGSGLEVGVFGRGIIACARLALGEDRAATAAWQEMLAAPALPAQTAAAVHAHLALQDLAAGEHPQEALAQLYQAVQLDPDHFAAHYNLAVIYAHWCGVDDAPDLARQHAHRAAALRPEEPLALVLLGSVHAAQGRWAEAVDAYQRGLELDPSALAIWNKLGLAYYAMGDKEQAQGAFSQTLSVAQSSQPYREGSASFWAELGLAASYLGLHEQALEAYAMAQQLGATDSALYRRMARLFWQQGEVEAAINAYGQAQEQYASDPLAAMELGDLYRQVGNLEAAEAAYLRAIAGSPCQAAPFLSLGELCFDRGDYGQAAVYLGQGLALDPTHAEAQRALGVAFYLDQQWDKALAAFQAAASLEPDHVEAYLGMGRIYAQRGEHAPSRDAYAQAIQVSPDSVNAWVGLGDAHRGLGSWREAEAAYRRALQLAPEDANLWLVLATLYDSQGDLDRAIDAYKAALALEEGALGHAALGSAYQRRGNISLAAQEYERALAVDPKNPEYQVALALVYIAQDQLTRASELTAAALEAQPDYALAHFLSGLILEKRGEVDEAILAYGKAAEHSQGDMAIYNNAQAQLKRLGAGR